MTPDPTGPPSANGPAGTPAIGAAPPAIGAAPPAIGAAPPAIKLSAAAPRVVVVGGGLAGLAAATALADSGCRVQIYEARRTLGGRAGSFSDPATGERVDQCQHVSMGCCTNLADFCRRTGTSDLFTHERRLHFVGPNGQTYAFQADRLPAPLHLARAFWGLKYLSLADRWRIARATFRLMRLPDRPEHRQLSVGDWLRAQGQTPAAIANYWGVILVSALGEDLDRASLSAARKVIVDGFLTSPQAYVVEVPRVPLGELYGEALEQFFRERGVTLHKNSPVRQVRLNPTLQLELADGQTVDADYCVLAVPWTRLPELVAPELAQHWPWLAGLQAIEASPITAVHLWFDRPILPLAQAVLVGRLAQWIFSRPGEAVAGSHEPRQTFGEHYYQVVISASRGLAKSTQTETIAQVVRELGEIWPAARSATLVRSRVVTQPLAVFSESPGLAALRPNQQTESSRITVAGDWTDTAWPSTMESAVRSGYLAAEAILRSTGRPQRYLAPDLPWGKLASLLIRRWA